MATIRPNKPCKKAGCRCDAEKNGYCLEHYQEWYSKLCAYRDRNRLNFRQRGYTSQWDKARKVFLIEHPICVRCGQPATVVDHITPHKGDKQLFWNMANWQPLCKLCHDRKTALEDSNFVRTRTHTPRGG